MIYGTQLVEDTYIAFLKGLLQQEDFWGDFFNKIIYKGGIK